MYQKIIIFHGKTNTISMAIRKVNHSDVNMYQRQNLHFPVVFPMVFQFSYRFSYGFHAEISQDRLPARGARGRHMGRHAEAFWGPTFSQNFWEEDGK